MDAPSTRYRFVPEADKLAAFFRAYQEERRALGIGTTIAHVSPRQRVDAITLMLGLNADGGWRRIDGEGPKALWLRYLRPVLAETRESAAALKALVERRELPGAFEPVFGEPSPPPPPPPPPRPFTPTPPPPPPPAAWRLALRMRREYVLRAMTVPRVSTALVLVVLVAGGFVVARAARKPLPASVQAAAPLLPIVRPTPPAPLSADQAATVSRPAGDAYQAAVDLIAAALTQEAGRLTPRDLAAFFAGASDSTGEPAAFLAEMLRRWPMPAGDPVPLAPPDFRALREFAAAAASVDSALPADAFEPLVQASATPPAWNRLPVAAPATVAASASASWPGWLPRLAFLPLLPLLVWSLASLPRALRAGLRNPRAHETGTPVVLPIALLTASAPHPSRWLSRRLSEREPFPGRRLNADRTVRATLAAGGFPTLVMRPALRTTDIVFLVARRHGYDHERDRVLRLIIALKQGGVPLFAYDYDPDPRSMFPISNADAVRSGGPMATQRLDLRALRELHGEARLVLVTDGRELVEYFSQRPLRFLQELRNWPRRMLLTPVPLADWGEREMNLSRALDARIGRATEEGFTDLAYVFEPHPRHLHREALKEASRQEGTVARLVSWLAMADRLVRPDGVAARPAAVRFDDPALVSDADPSEPFQAACLAALRDWLGRPGYLWLAACAAYPQTRFNVTAYLGLDLTFHTRDGETPLFSERLLARLTALPWFQNGRMPPWLRRALLDSLSDGARTRVRLAIDRMLAGKDTTATGQKTTDLTIWRPENRALDLPPDAILADLMLTRRSDLVPILRGRLFAEVFRASKSRAFGRRLFALGATLAWCLTAWWVWPGTEDGPHAAGAWLPLAAVVAATLALGALWLVLAWGVRRARMRQGAVAAPASGPDVVSAASPVIETESSPEPASPETPVFEPGLEAEAAARPDTDAGGAAESSSDQDRPQWGPPA